jgi:hypothetical protein
MFLDESAASLTYVLFLSLGKTQRIKGEGWMQIKAVDRR